MTVSAEMPAKGKPVLILVRHGESIANVNKSLMERISDPAIFLTEKGHDQALQSSEALVGYLEKQNLPKDTCIRVMRSEYERAQQTSKPFIAALEAAGFTNLDSTIEHRLRELDFAYDRYFTKLPGGMAEGAPYAKEHSDILRVQGYKFYAQRFGGESPAQVDTRIRPLLNAIYRDMEENGITHFVIVTHGLTMRVLIRALMKYDNAWYQEEWNPGNASIRVIDRGEDMGYIFPSENGQWDPSWKDTPDDPDKIDSKGKIFRHEQLETLMNLQKTQPDVMKRLAEVFKKHPEICCNDAMATLSGLND